jgi:SAM-dependent methyltransferase
LCAGWQGRRVLEVGSGTGRFSAQLQRLGAEMVLADLCVEMLLAARGRLVAAGGAPRALNASAYSLPVAAGSVDCVLSINVFNHLGSPDLALAEMARALRPGGELVVNFANASSYYWPAAALISLRRRALGQNVYSRWLARPAIEATLRGAGLTVLAMLGSVHVPRALDLPGVRRLPMALDAVSRRGRLSGLAPVLYYRCEKAG